MITGRIRMSRVRVSPFNRDDAPKPFCHSFLKAYLLPTHTRSHFKIPNPIPIPIPLLKTEMAVSSGVFSSFFVSQSASFVKQSPVAVKLTPTNLPLRAATITAAAAKPATDTKKREPRGIMKPRRVSPEMQAFLGGVAEIPRTQALKEIWDYIKQQNLQDPADKKVIICDDKLKTIFAGKDRVGFLEIAGLISPHFLK